MPRRYMIHQHTVLKGPANFDNGFVVFKTGVAEDFVSGVAVAKAGVPEDFVSGVVVVKAGVPVDCVYV